MRWETPNTVLTTGEARHLLRRTGFGAPRKEVEKLAGQTRGEAADKLLKFKPKRFKPLGRFRDDEVPGIDHSHEVARVHARDQEPAAGEARAVLARPLRHQLRRRSADTVLMATQNALLRSTARATSGTS